MVWLRYRLYIKQKSFLVKSCVVLQYLLINVDKGILKGSFCVNIFSEALLDGISVR